MRAHRPIDRLVSGPGVNEPDLGGRPVTEPKDGTAAETLPSGLLRSILALLPALLALSLQLALWPVIQPSVWFLFYPAVFLSSWIGGVRAAIIASVMCGAAALWFFLPPVHSFSVPFGQYLAAGVLVATGVLFGVFHDRLRTANQRAARALAASEEANAELKKVDKERRIFSALIEETNEAVSSLVELAPEGIFTADRDGRYTDVNTAACRMLGFTREEIVGKTILDLIPADRVEQLEREREQLLRGQDVVSEWALRRKDGSWLPVEVSAKILPDGRWQGFVRDIGERKRREEQLRQTQERLELALRGGDLAAWDWNVASGEVVFNARWAEMRGYRPEEIRGHVDSWTSGVHPDDWPQVERTLQDHFQGHRPEYETEHRVRTRSGQWIWILDRGKVFARNEQGEPVRMLGTEIDITSRKHAEEALKFLSEVGSVLASSLELEATLASIGQLTTRTFADLCIVYVVQEGGEVRRVKAVAGDPGRDWICDALTRMPLDRSRAHDIWSELDANRSVLMERVSAESVTAFAQSEEHLRALRALDPKSVIMAPLFAHGKLLGAMAFISSAPSRVYSPVDVRFAEQIAQRAAYAIDNAQLYATARRAIEARDTVLGIVAHDLRNPLGAILMHAALLRRSEGEPEVRARRSAEAIERTGKRMNRIIQDLLDVIRMEEGQLSVEQGRVSPCQAISDSVDAQAPVAAAASVELRLEVAGDLPDVWADRDRLLQIFDNIIGNAVKFTSAGGVVRVGAAERDGAVLFWVADTGVGIGAESLPHVFDRFWQARRGERRGVGLGLAIVKGLVEAHGGRIWVESALDRGTTFFFTIPMAPGAEQRPREDSASRPSPSVRGAAPPRAHG